MNVIPNKELPTVASNLLLCWRQRAPTPSSTPGRKDEDVSRPQNFRWDFSVYELQETLTGVLRDEAKGKMKTGNVDSEIPSIFQFRTDQHSSTVWSGHYTFNCPQSSRRTLKLTKRSSNNSLSLSTCFCHQRRFRDIRWGTKWKVITSIRAQD